MNVPVVATRPPLWTRRDAVRVGVLLVLGAGVIGASWFFAAGRPDAGDQLVLVSLALLGALIGMVATASWMRQGRQAIRVRTRRLLGDAPAGASGAPAAAALVAGADTRWFHRADCLLVQGRSWATSPRTVHEAAGRRACPACRPAGAAS